MNLESDSESDDEVDNTKEIQIEEALKLYQAAIKYHSEGPGSFEKAAEAYKALFLSEIFKYSESLSEFQREELHGEAPDTEALLLDEFEAGPALLTGGGESAPNTLPQILHLSYRNHAQFMLEKLQYELQLYVSSPENQLAPITSRQIAQASDAPLRYFSEALDKDDTDMELWSRTSYVADLVGSHRIARYCLEAVLDGDVEGLDSILRLPGLEEGFAKLQLKEMVSKLEDDLSLLQAPLYAVKRKNLSAALKRRLTRYLLTELSVSFRNELDRPDVTGSSPSRFYIKPVRHTWAAVGEALLQHIHTEHGGFVDLGPGPGVAVNPSEDRSEDETNPADGVQVVDSDTSTELTQRNMQDTSKEENTSEAKSVSVERPDDSNQAKESPSELGEQEVVGYVIEQPGPNAALIRKRSTESAGLPEVADGGRARSKRIRARESIVDANQSNENLNQENAQKIESQLSEFEQADNFLYEIVDDLLEPFEVVKFGLAADMRKDIVQSSELTATERNDLVQARADLLSTFQSNDAQTAATILQKDNVDHLGEMTREAGLNAFLSAAKSGTLPKCSKPVLNGDDGINVWSHRINSRWTSAKEAAWLWIECLLRKGKFPSQDGAYTTQNSSYISHQWTDDLKRAVVQILVNLDDYFYHRLAEEIAVVDSQRLKMNLHSRVAPLSGEQTSLFEMSQSIFELHLDVYSLIRHPGSGVDMDRQTVQKDRLDRWAALARHALNLHSTLGSLETDQELALRHVWASVFHISVCDDVQQAHIIACIEEMKQHFQDLDDPVIQLQNNAVMPELSVAAIDRELAQINMKDFFIKVFDSNDEDPVNVIESLEPILEPLENVRFENNTEFSDERASNQSSAAEAETGERQRKQSVDLRQPSPVIEMRNFLESANMSLRLSLWQRLREAYEKIGYTPKVVSCYFRNIELLLDSLRNQTYLGGTANHRQITLLNELKLVDEIVVKIFSNLKLSADPFESFDYEHIRSSMNAIVELLKLLAAANAYEDLSRVGSLPGTNLDARGITSGSTILPKLREIQIRVWSLLYLLFKEGIPQKPEPFTAPADAKFEFLRHVHYATGIRGFCHVAGKMLLKLIRDELLDLDDIADGNTRDNVFAQVLYDLYGLKCFVNPADCAEWGSPIEPIDRKVATRLLDFLMSQARKVNIKDLHRTDLKSAIDKVHGALGKPKANEDMALNRKVLTLFLKSPINPVDLYRCLEGIGTLSTKPISPDRAIAASKGWYFLMGNIALNKFKSQKRVAAGPMEDVNIAAAFFMQDLEYTPECWETWYRLAQAHDTQLEEAVSWTAEKLNGSSAEIAQYQRSAIHCYIMAVACAVRNADYSPLTSIKIAEMYAEFGNRMFSSSREPFSMTVFSFKDVEQRYFSGSAVFQSVPFQPLRLYTAWKLASVLYKRAISRDPDKWTNYYMLGKCLWKMHTTADDLYGTEKPPPIEEVLSAFTQAIETLPQQRRDSKKDPVLEPHYKLVSIVHKLVLRQEMDPEAASEKLKATPYTKNIEPVARIDDWEGYILSVLRVLRAADKSGWHHRMTARAAHVLYDTESADVMAAMGAKHEMTQSIFTKTMAVQVWKPENERAGRHFVYTTRYTRFFLHLLIKLTERVNLEALARRVRKKPHEFYDHGRLWQEMCLAYLKMLRRKGVVPEGHEDAIFKSLNYDEFSIRATRLESWCHEQATESPLVEVLRDVIELKRLNNNLIKPTLIDDLIGDTYALLYEQVGLNLDPLPSESKRIANLAGNSESALSNQGSHFLNADGAGDFKLTQTNVPAIVAADPPPKSRAKAVGRRELQRRAEAAVTKPAAAASTVTMPIRTPQTVHVVIPPKSTISTSTQPEKHIKTTEVSLPVNLLDSGDDESELSELNDEDVTRPEEFGPEREEAPSEEADEEETADEDENEENELEDQDEEVHEGEAEGRDKSAEGGKEVKDEIGE